MITLFSKKTKCMSSGMTEFVYLLSGNWLVCDYLFNYQFSIRNALREVKAWSHSPPFKAWVWNDLNFKNETNLSSLSGYLRYFHSCYIFFHNHGLYVIMISKFIIGVNDRKIMSLDCVMSDFGVWEAYFLKPKDFSLTCRHSHNFHSSYITFLLDCRKNCLLSNDMPG